MHDGLRSSFRKIILSVFNLETTINLVEEFKDRLKDRFIISESGISSAEDIKRLMNYGVKGFLVGESLMRQEDVKAAAIELFRGVF
ncbi:MAG: hypothetical protein ACOYK1_06420 [Vampirovibrionia bacterium]|jgi:indole-3-glycerol phosphate synthase